MIDLSEVNLTSEDHDKAFTEVCFLLEMLVDTSAAVAGNSAPAVGTNAGRYMGKKLPIYLEDPSFQEVLGEVAENLRGGFGIKVSCNENVAEVDFGRCAIRDVCKNRGLELGGQLCQMFHYYLAGIAAELYGKPVRPTIADTGETCTSKMETR